MTETAAGPRAAHEEHVSVAARRASAELNGAVVLRGRESARRGATAPDRLRRRLERLQAATAEELDRRRSAAGPEPVTGAAVPVRRYSSLTREVPRLAQEAPHVIGAAAEHLDPEDLRRELVELLHGLTATLRRARLIGRHHREGEYDLDDFGFDREWTDALLPLFRFLYRRWWRVRTVGLENVPADGGALLVSNHSGVLPYDGAMIRTALVEDHPAGRHARALILNAFFSMPVVSWFLRRTGNTLAHPGDAERLLERGELVLVFPEGARGTGKLYRERYRLRRFGRGGFVQVALRTGTPIVPVSVVGSEEIHPMVANATPVARLLGLPYFPLTPTFPWLGPLGLIPLPSTWFIEFHQPIETADLGSDSADDPALVLQLSDQVRDVIQDGVYRNLERRGRIFA